ncbi:hypothetical protein [Mycolicibacterium fluoranthenivorans]|uniref:Uncharacterized protein n=1 Tax=Mycolicibacterium fluoranthenivorans TaxID=258505 RepID=A0A7X5U0Z1_9MYCO|nr:hypothetical protein [Mycolicibacterium fluoranthenivorans]MCV7355014.1 hypothetical protein [Mycolicibacterium fluoranthenivorans]NIH96393.1 hypothetical protein [Mycolicibacterium fluoranthenivorans]
MSISLLHDPTVDVHAHGLTTVCRRGIGHSTARCSCGWNGTRRRLKAVAAQDAWTHCLQRGCDVSVPLVFGG